MTARSGVYMQLMSITRYRNIHIYFTHIFVYICVADRM